MASFHVAKQHVQYKPGNSLAKSMAHDTRVGGLFADVGERGYWNEVENQVVSMRQ